MRNARRLLQLASARFMLPSGKRLALYVEDDQLKLGYPLPSGEWQPVNIEEEDLDKTPEQLVDEIADVMGNP